MSTITRVKINDSVLWVPTVAQAVKFMNDTMRELSAAGEARAVVAIDSFKQPSTRVGLCAMLNGSVDQFLVSEGDNDEGQGDQYPPHVETLGPLDDAR